MPDINSAVPNDLPSTRKLVRSTILAAVIASLLLATLVLPAEYGVDPTGIGGVLGLTEMGRIKQSLAREAAADAAAPVATTPVTSSVTPAVATAPPASTPDSNSHETKVTLQPGEGKEIKLVMREGARVKYSWSTDRGVVNYDTHADSTMPRRDYHGYAKGTAVPSDSGELVAAFDGSHGWFWRNRTRQEVTVTLKTEGQYLELKELK